jgi:beta-glucosidase
MVQNSDVILIAFLPGPDGGQAVVDLITGNYNPSGRLPITYPKYADKSGVPYWHAVSDMCTSPSDKNAPLPHYQYTNCEVEWKFGHGLSYTNIVYSDIKFSGTKLTISKNNDFNASIKVTLRVKNTGNRSVSETIMLFIFVENRLVTPENKLLWHFEKVALDVGEEKKIQTELSIDHLRFIGPHDDTHMVIQPGMNVKIGVGPYVDCRVDNSDLCSDSISVIMKDGEQYEASCEAACSLWKKSDCIDVYNFSSDMCWEKCLSSDSSTTTVGW